MASPTLVQPVGDSADNPDHYAPLCIAVFRPRLTAYLAGTDTVDGFAEQLALGTHSTRRLMARRLQIATQVVRIFAAENIAAAAGGWLRDVEPRWGRAPATVIRDLVDDEGAVKELVEAARAWVNDQRFTWDNGHL